mmetsp:Transcript_26890/g.62782  ORF Transcript_26890/g.62782 Transcript_26890/m.62782 type:complete len:277 (-) Transcript_26890:428-1258(-)
MSRGSASTRAGSSPSCLGIIHLGVSGTMRSTRRGAVRRASACPTPTRRATGTSGCAASARCSGAASPTRLARTGTSCLRTRSSRGPPGARSSRSIRSWMPRRSTRSARLRSAGCCAMSTWASPTRTALSRKGKCPALPEERRCSGSTRSCARSATRTAPSPSLRSISRAPSCKRSAPSVICSARSRSRPRARKAFTSGSWRWRCIRSISRLCIRSIRSIIYLFRLCAWWTRFARPALHSSTRKSITSAPSSPSSVSLAARKRGARSRTRTRRASLR